jgi:hypothetical protein
MCVYIYIYMCVCVCLRQPNNIGSWPRIAWVPETICNMYGGVRRGFFVGFTLAAFFTIPIPWAFWVYHPQMGLVSMAKRLAGLSLAFLTESSVRWRCPHGFASLSSWNTSPCFRCSGHLGSIILAVRNKASHPRNHRKTRLILPVFIFNLERAPNKFLYRWYPMITDNSNRNWRIQPRRRPSLTRFGWIQI